METRGRKKGSVKNRIPTAVINEWADVYNEGGDGGKTLVIKRIKALGLEKDSILERMAEAYEKKLPPELKKAVEQEVAILMTKVASLVEGVEIQRLHELVPRYNIVINLDTLEVERAKRPISRAKKGE